MMPHTTQSKGITCPSCGNKAKRVSTITIGAMLIDVLAQEFNPDGLTCRDPNESGCNPAKGDAEWRFCDSIECDVVYFSEHRDLRFVTSQLRVPVGVKQAKGARPLCYCFGHSVASIKEEMRDKGSSDALEDIRQKMKVPGCRCRTENPSGSCCLRSVKLGIRAAREELGVTDIKILPAERALGLSSSRGETIAKIGTIFSAIMASSCCWLPLVLLAAGVSGAGIATMLELYRPLFIAVTCSFLAAAFYYTYRPNKTAAGSGNECCNFQGVGDCDSPGKGRSNALTWDKAMLWAVTVLAVAFLVFPSYVGAFLGAEATGVAANMVHSVFVIEGMTCEGCSAVVAIAIRDVPGVLTADVNYADGKAVVGTEACCPVADELIMEAIKNAGYQGTPLL